MIGSQLTTVYSRWWQTVGNGVIALAALGGVVLMQQSRLEQAALNPLNPQQAEQRAALELELVRRSPTLGFDNLIANWAFIKFITYFGDYDLRDLTGYELNDDYFDLLTRRDPRFMEAYLFISSAVSFMQGKPELGVELMQRGTDVLSPKINPRSYLLWRYKGIDQILLTNDIPGAIKSHEMAAEWVKGTADEAFAPIYAQTAEFLKSNPDNTSVRFWAWSEVYHSTVDKNVKARAEAELLKLGANKRVDAEGNVFFALPVPNSNQ